MPDPAEPFRIAPDLAGRRAVVTGGASGIGLGIARWLAASGAHVSLIDETFHGAADELVGEGFSLVRQDMSVADPEGLAEDVLRSGPVELIVNNVGVTTDHRFTELSAEDFDRVMAVNLRAPWFFTRRLVQELLDDGGRGSVLFISSLHDHVVRLFPHYSASKAATAMLVRELAHELGPRGLRVNAISPGWIETQPVDDVARTRASRAIPLARMGTPADIGPVATLLLSDALSGYITGANVPVDGGLDLHTWLAAD